MPDSLEASNDTNRPSYIILLFRQRSNYEYSPYSWIRFTSRLRFQELISCRSSRPCFCFNALQLCLAVGKFFSNPRNSSATRVHPRPEMFKLPLAPLYLAANSVFTIFVFDGSPLPFYSQVTIQHRGSAALAAKQINKNTKDLQFVRGRIYQRGISVCYFLQNVEIKQAISEQRPRGS